MKSLGLIALAMFAATASWALRIEPVYPKHALEQCIEGWVHLEAELDEAGSVLQVSVLDSEPAGVFEEAALANARWQDWSSELPDERGMVTHKVTFEIEGGCDAPST